MPINAEDFYTSAKNIVGQEATSEVDRRTAISRAYYSVYHKVLSVLDNDPRSYSGKGCHGSLIHYLQTDAQHEESIEFSTLRRIAYILKQERDNRILADYKLDAEVSPLLVERTFASVDRCFSIIDESRVQNSQSS